MKHRAGKAATLSSGSTNDLFVWWRMEQRTITFSDGRKTKLRLEPAYWLALEDISEREGWGAVELIEFLRSRSAGAPLARVCRAHAVNYYRDAALGAGSLDEALLAAAETGAATRAKAGVTRRRPPPLHC